MPQITYRRITPAEMKKAKSLYTIGRKIHMGSSDQIPRYISEELGLPLNIAQELVRNFDNHDYFGAAFTTYNGDIVIAPAGKFNPERMHLGTMVAHEVAHSKGLQKAEGSRDDQALFCVLHQNEILDELVAIHYALAKTGDKKAFENTLQHQRLCYARAQKDNPGANSLSFQELEEIATQIVDEKLDAKPGQRTGPKRRKHKNLLAAQLAAWK